MREVINEVSIGVSTETPKTMLKIPRILIAAPSSGSGKTLFTCALLRLLQRKGIRAAAFKCGPDYIDPMFHRDVLGTPSRNLDLYLAGEEGVRRSLAAGFREANAEIAVIEGVMGYLDGTGESGLTGSSYHLAVSTHTPVILTVNARGMSRSAAALVKGFAEYGTDRQIKGLFLNRVSQPSAGMIANWIREDTDLPVLASLPQEKAITFTSRHLGLIEPGEIPDLQNRIERAADLLEETMDLDQLLAIARSAPDVSAPVDTGHTKAVPSDRTGAKAGGTELQTQDPHSPVTIAVAMDEAFSFYYEDNLELLASYGAQILRFSPIHDSRIPDADGLLLGGGYPELWAEKLSSNKSMRTSIRSAAEDGMPILAECGGFQYLQQELETKDGAVCEMAGVLDGRSAMTGKLVRFGYVALSAKEGTAGEIYGHAAGHKTIYLDPGQTIRGHEFHYSDSTCNGDAFTAVKPNGRHWDCMVAKGRILAGYPHLYYPSCPPLAERFVSACRDYRQERGGTKAKSSASGV